MSLLGAAAQYASAKSLQEDAQKFQTEFYKQRYQRQMEDMRKAGLNPILSYKTGVPGGTTAGIASTSGIASAIGEGIDRPVKMAQEWSAKKLKDKQAQAADAQTGMYSALGAKAAFEGEATAATLPRLRALAGWDMAHPSQIHDQRAAQTRAITGDRATDQAIGFGLNAITSGKSAFERGRQRFRDFRKTSTDMERERQLRQNR